MAKKILIVEDNPDLMYVLRKQVENLGFQTVLAVNGKQAVELAATQLPDLILMDMMMPQMNGMEATRLIRQNPKTQAVPILAVTVLQTHEDREKCLQSGCNDYLNKPFTYEQLGSRIEKLLQQQPA